MRANREEFKCEMINTVDCAAVEMFKSYDAMNGHVSFEFVEKRGFFEGVISGMLKFCEKFTGKDMSAEHDRAMEVLDEELQSIDTDEEREAMLDACYELIEGLAVLIYDKKKGVKDEAA